MNINGTILYIIIRYHYTKYPTSYMNDHEKSHLQIYNLHSIQKSGFISTKPVPFDKRVCCPIIHAISLYLKKAI